jgi:hypothetical protein
MNLDKFCKKLVCKLFKNDNFIDYEINKTIYKNYIGVAIKLPNSNFNFKNFIPSKLPLRNLGEFEIILFFRKQTVLNNNFLNETYFGLLIQGSAMQTKRKIEQEQGRGE